MKSYGKQIRQTILLSPELRAKLDAVQRRTGASLCEIIRRLVEEGLDRLAPTNEQRQDQK